MFDLSRECRMLSEEADQIDWNSLEGHSVLITGATGLVGSTCVRALLEHNRCSSSKQVAIYALVRNEEKARNLFKEYLSDSHFFLVVQDVNSFKFEKACDYIIHAACPTSSSFFVDHPVETADAIILGTKNMLSYALECDAKAMVYLSSMEVYGNGNSEPGLNSLLTEKMVGSSDTTLPRSSYPEAKRMAENYCASFASEYGLNVKIVRLAQTFGPGISKSDNRLFAQIARSAISGKDLILKTTGASTRMYIYTLDAVTAIFDVLLRGQAGQAYNAANPSTYSSVLDMSEMVMRELGRGGSRVVIDIDPNTPYLSEHHYPLDTSKLEQLGWRPRVDLLEMFKMLIKYLEA